MARVKLANRDPNWKDPETGKLVYSLKDRVKIWHAKLQEECFPHKRPTGTQRVSLAAAVCLIISLSDMHLAFQEGKPLPKNYIPTVNTLRSTLATLRVKAPRKANQQADPDKGLGLAAILGGEA